MPTRLKAAYARLASGEAEIYPPRQLCTADLERVCSEITVSMLPLSALAGGRFINTPEAFIRGILVNQQGECICNEMLYGAQLGERIMKLGAGKAWLIIDKTLFKQAHGEISPKRAMWFQSVAALIFLYAASRRGNSLEALAKKLGIPAATLSQTLANYNELAESEQQDAMGKPKQFFSVLDNGPYYALDCSADALMMCPTLSLGGIKVNERTGEVLSARGETINGLYAARRSAVGVASRSTVSGLSIADCIFSGCRAGSHAAMRSKV